MMGPSTTDFLTGFYSNADVFFLILVRYFGFFMLIPVLSGQYVTNRVRISLAVFTALIAVSSGTVDLTVNESSLVGYLSLFTGELVIGLIISFAVYMAFSALLLAGQLIDFSVGFSMVSVFDPVSQVQVPITGNLYYLTAVMLFVQLGGLSSFIHTVFYSYEVIPIGKAFMLGNYNLMGYAIKMMSSFFLLGVRISLPIVGTIILVDIALGLLTKAVPQMNIFVVGMPIKLLIGLLVLFVTAPLLSDFYRATYDLAINGTLELIKGMMH